MEAAQKRNVIIAVAGALLVAGVLWLVFGGDAEGLRDVTADAKEAREAMQVLEAIARDPESVADHMTPRDSTQVQPLTETARE